jgi:hypothetical protein
LIRKEWKDLDKFVGNMCDDTTNQSADQHSPGQRLDVDTQSGNNTHNGGEEKKPADPPTPLKIQ